MNNTQEQIEIINGQMIASTLFIVSIAIAILLLYNNKLDLEGKETILTPKEAENIAILNKLFALLLLTYFLYVSIQEYQKQPSSDAYLQVLASLLVVIASLITGYVLLKNYDENKEPNISIDNPEI